MTVSTRSVSLSYQSMIKQPIFSEKSYRFFTTIPEFNLTDNRKSTRLAIKSDNKISRFEHQKNKDLTNKWDTQLTEQDYIDISEMSQKLTNMMYAPKTDGFELELKDINVDEKMKQIRKTGILPERVYTRKMIRILGSQKKLEDAEYLWKKMEEQGESRDIWEYTAIMSAYCESGNIQKVEEIMKLAETRGIICDNYCYSIYIKSLVNNGSITKACKVLNDMWIKKGIMPDNITFSILIKGCMDKKQYDRLWELYNLMKTYIGEPDVITSSLMIKVLSYTNRFEEAMNIFETVDKVQPVTQGLYHSIMSTTAKSQKYELATFTYFERMKRDNFIPNLQSYNILLKACATSGDLVKANEVLRQLEEDGLVPDSYTYTYLLKCLSRASHNGLPYPEHPVGNRRYTPDELEKEEIYEYNKKDVLDIETIKNRLYLNKGGTIKDYEDDDGSINVNKKNYIQSKYALGSEKKMLRGHEQKGGEEEEEIDLYDKLYNQKKIREKESTEIDIDIDKDNLIKKEMNITEEEEAYVKELIKNQILMNRQKIKMNGNSLSHGNSFLQPTQKTSTQSKDMSLMEEDWESELKEGYKQALSLYTQQNPDSTTNSVSLDSSTTIKGRGRKIHSHGNPDTKLNEARWMEAINSVLNHDATYITPEKTEKEKEEDKYIQKVNDIQEELQFIKGHKPSSYELIQAIHNIPIPTGDMTETKSTETTTSFVRHRSSSQSIAEKQKEKEKKQSLTTINDSISINPTSLFLLSSPAGMDSLVDLNIRYLVHKAHKTDIYTYVRKEATRVFEEGIKNLGKPTKEMLNAYVQSFTECYALNIAIEKAKLFQTYGYEYDEVTYHNLITMYIKTKRFEKASELVKEMEEKHLTPRPETYGEIIDGYARKNDLEQCLLILTYIKEKGLKYPKEKYLEKCRVLCLKKGLINHPSLPPNPFEYAHEFYTAQKKQTRVSRKRTQQVLRK
ncbi:hypothetical protein WA158_007273 [Blastocystis sp. Blastoise]